MSHRARWFVAGAMVLLGLCMNPAWAADTGKLVEKDGRYVFVESMDPATKLLLQRAVRDRKSVV